MKKRRKSNEEPWDQLRKLRLRVAELEESEARRAKVERAVELSERYFRSLIENVQDIVTMLDVDGNVTYQSPSIKRVLGYEEDELLRRNVLELLHPDDVAAAVEKMGHVVKDRGSTATMEVRFRHKDGRWLFMEGEGKAIVGDSELTGIIVNSHDITERKRIEGELLQRRELLERAVVERTSELRESAERLKREVAAHERAEEALRGSEERYRNLVENINDAIFTVDERGDLTFMSPVMERILGYKAEEVIGENFTRFVHPEDLEEAVWSLGESLRGRLHLTELRVVDKDGDIKYIRSSSRPLVKDGRTVGLSGILTDVTERKLAEEALRESEEKFRSLIERATDIIVILDGEGKVLYGSPSNRRILSYEEEGFVGRNVFEMVHPDDREKAIAVFERSTIAPGGIGQLDLRFETAHGDWRDLEVVGYNLLDDPCVRGVVINAHDITDRKLAEEALRESEEKFRLLSEQSMMGIIIIQEDMVKYANRAAEEIFGYGVDESMDWPPGEFTKTIHPDDRGFVMRQIAKKQCEEKDAIVNYRARGITSSGEEKWMEVYSKTVYLAGEPINLITMIDISERVFMEEELKNREEHYRTLTENALDVTSIVNRDGVITYISPSVEKVLGYGPEEIINDVGFSFVHPDDVSKAAEGLRYVLEHPQEVFNVELRTRHKDGGWRDIEITGRNFLDHPSMRGIVANYRDITESKLTRERLEGINRLFLSLGADLIDNMERIVRTTRDILGGAMAAYCRVEKGKLSVLSTAPGGEDFNVTGDFDDYIGARMISGTGRSPVIIQDVDSTTYAARDPLVRKYGMRSFLGYPVRVKDKKIGCLCLLDAEVREFSHEDLEILGMLARALSVEEERLASEQSMKDFIDIASHELRHPITLMKGYALTLRDYGERVDEDSRREFLAIIGQGADRLNSLIKELLDVSRIERGRFSINKKRINLEPLIQRAVSEMTDRGCEDRFLVSIPEDMDPQRVDPEKLVSVLVILLENAVNHSPDGAPVEIDAERVDGGTVISVLDRGVGVPEKSRKLIFERFYQVEDALHHSKPGMGLGLYIAREIVEAHGGCIWCEPREGGGSVFRFSIPGKE
ncbi:MAG: PAS domain S-box protein [Actinomycetota bacterium]|nr:PAS domain S-box protein [Actinomycetota bacterium]